MNDEIYTIAIPVLTNGTVLALFVWILKFSFQKALDKSAELYARELDLMHKKDFLKYSKIYDEQAVTLSDTYKILVMLYEHASHLAFQYKFYEENPQFLEKYRVPKTGDAKAWQRYHEATLSHKPADARANTLEHSAAVALAEFKPKRIYFDVELADEVERLLNLLLFVGSSFPNINVRDPETLEPAVSEEVIEVWKKVVTACHGLFPQMENEFRRHLKTP